MSGKPLKLTEIAALISRHLKALEAEKAWNRHVWTDRNGDERVQSRLYNANARCGGSRVMVTYISYQGSCSLTRDEALAYLAWLDAGNRDTHFRMPGEAA